MAYLIELTAPGEVSVRPYETPEPGVGEVRVATLFSGISAGTERATYRGSSPYLNKRWDPATGLFLVGGSTFDYPLDVWGYSEVGVVEAVGGDVHDPVVGETVWGIWGHRSHAVLPADRLAGHQLGSGLDPVVGTFDRVGAVALNAILAADARIGERVAVFGLGVIGLLATQLLVGQGIEVVAVDPVPHRLALATRFGATAISASEPDVAVKIQAAVGEMDRVIELTGAYSALHEAIRVAGTGGTVVAAGFYQGPAAALNLGEEFHHNRVSLVPSQIGALPAVLRERWTRERLHETVMALCRTGRLDPAPLISHLLPAREAAAAYRLVDDPPADLLQVVLDFREPARCDTR